MIRVTSVAWIIPKIETEPGVRLRWVLSCSADANESFFLAFRVLQRTLRSRRL